MAEQPNGGPGIMDQLPTDQLKQELKQLVKAMGAKATRSLTDKLSGAGGKAAEAVRGAGEQVGEQVSEAAGGAGGLAKKAVGAGVKGAAGKVGEKITGGGGDGGGGGGGKVTNIVEEIDVGVPVSVAYNQWTRFTDFPGFMKKVENVEQVSDTELKWRGKVLWSSRDWKSTILDQVPDRHIVWTSEGSKGYVNGTVSFHELTPTLTRILVVLEYYPQGFFEKTGNLWRAQGRRARLEIKHFRRHVMTQVALHPEEVEGWRGEIHDSEVQQEAQDEAQEGAKDEAQEGAKDEAQEGAKDEAQEGAQEGGQDEAQEGQRDGEQPQDQQQEQPRDEQQKAEQKQKG
jgi:uncharacterized membrane protein